MKNWIKRLLEPQTVILLLTFFAAVYIGIQQNNINTKLKDIALKELISSKSPLLEMDFDKFEYDPTSKAVTRDLKFSNKGSVPLNIVNYEVDYPGNILEMPPSQQFISGTLFQGESVVKGTLVRDEGDSFQEQQLIVVEANFVSIFDSTKQFCARRTYIYDSNNNQLRILDLTTITNTECK